MNPDDMYHATTTSTRHFTHTWRRVFGVAFLVERVMFFVLHCDARKLRPAAKPRAPAATPLPRRCVRTRAQRRLL